MGQTRPAAIWRAVSGTATCTRTNPPLGREFRARKARLFGA